MSMLGLLWKVGVLSAAVVFGLKAGLALGFSGLRRSVRALIIAGYAASLYGLVLVAAKFLPLLQELATRYNYVAFLAMSVLIIWAGVYTLREWQVHGADCAGVSWVALAAPCPCCYGAVILTIALAAPFLGLSVVVMGKYAAWTLGVTILAADLLGGQIARLTKKPHPVLLGNMMLLVGFYFLVSAMIIPSMGSLEGVKMTPLLLLEPQLILLFAGLLILLGGCGAIKQKKSGILR